MDKKERAIPIELPVICMDTSLMVFPGISTHLTDQNQETISNFIKKFGVTPERPWAILVMSNPEMKDFPDKFYRTGVVSKIKIDLEKGDTIFTGLYRAEILDLKGVFQDDNKDDKDPLYYLASIKYLHDENCDEYFISSETAIRGAFLIIRKLFLMYFREIHEIYDITTLAVNVSAIKKLDFQDKDAVDQAIWAILYHMPEEVRSSERQIFLESNNLIERIGLLGKLIDEHLRIASFASEHLQSLSRKSRAKLLKGEAQKFQNKSSESDQDEFTKGVHVDIKKRWDKFKEIRDSMNKDACEVVMEDMEKLKSFESPQGNTYEWPKYMRRVDFILGLPWKNEAPEGGDIVKVEQILDEDHYGLEHVKGRISEGVAPRILNPAGRGQILCFVGPPGVGKTSLAKSVARALGRKYIRMSLGGVSNEAQIRGHGITYIGSEPGEILKQIKRCGEKNPVFVFDEIDKLGGMSAQGDPSAAMLEVLDPEQNNSFKDHWAACSFDLSKVMFITTANVEDTIIPALRDRMDIIRLPGYLEVEKIEIAKRYLIPRLLTDLGLIQNGVEVVWEEELISKVIRSYTHEAGVRGLERTIATLLKKICREYLKSKTEGKPIQRFEITENKVNEYIGPPKFTRDRVRATKVGESIGLAWTPVGGDILYVQAEFYDRLDDKKVLDLTGMQGDVMKESAHLALTRLRNVLRENNVELAERLENNAIHLHIPEGAVRKDGPSAGVAIFCAFYSEATGKLVKQNLAMTGEIDNKARVLAVGGIREKVVAAERAGIEEIIMPKYNERNLHDVPSDVKNKLRFHFVETTDEVLEIVFP